MVRAVLAAMAAGEGTVEQILELARRHLEMDVAYVSCFTDGKQVYRALDGDRESFGMHVGDGPPLESTFCQLMVNGALPNLVPDVAADSRVRDLPTTRDGSIGSYIGVPLLLPDGQLYGSFCGLSHRAEPGLGHRDVQFMELLADLLVGQLNGEVSEQAEHARITALLDRGDITVAAQPIISLHDGRCVGVEALARFPAELGSPDTVFAAAHRVGLGAGLERLAAGAAVSGLFPLLAPDQYLGINMSPQAALALAPVANPDAAPLHRLVLEITEHAEIDSYAQLKDALQPMRDRGLRLAIDDAGAGYASLRHIIELQPEIIKIDRSLIDGVAADPTRRRVVSSFVLLALDLHATVVAEGIEQPADLEAVRDLGVDAAQGYLLASPTTDPSELARWAHHGPVGLR